MNNIRNKNSFRFIIAFSATCLLCACLTIKKSSDGLFHYDYCFAVSGENSILLSSKFCNIKDSSIVITGNVVDLGSKQPLHTVAIKLQSAIGDKRLMTLTDSLGNFYIKAPIDIYNLEALFIGLQTFKMKIPEQKNADLQLALGKASSFVTYEITSKKSLNKAQIRRKVEELLRSK